MELTSTNNLRMLRAPERQHSVVAFAPARVAIEFVRSCTLLRACLRLAAVVLLVTHAAQAQETNARWWPTQALPRSIAPIESQPSLALEMLLQSAAGLAAKAVNQHRAEEMIWVDNHNRDMTEWFTRFTQAHPEIRIAPRKSLWEQVERLSQAATVRGYILYRADSSPGGVNSYRPGMDCSVNVATSLAGLLEAVLVEEKLEKNAQAHGLKMLLDARGKTQAWCFETYRERFNPRLLCTQDPRKPHTRDLAIAQTAFTLYGDQEPLEAALRWLKPLSPILGWNGGDEFATTLLSTRYGHIQTATDWCMNLPVLMAGSDKEPAHPARLFDPGLINWRDERSAVSFVQTDGDNVQWMQGNFFQSNSNYWADPERGKIPFGWSCCFAHLVQLCPVAVDYAAATRTPNDSFIEWGGGYYFPDHFGSARSNRWELLARQAARTWALMKGTGTQVIGFNVDRHDSPEALKAYEVIARAADGLLGILVFQYDRYEAGAGETFWVNDKNGLEVPVVTARYAIWANANDRGRVGTPAKIAREIRDTANQRASAGSHYDWAISHAWSYFKKAPGSDEDAENLPQESASLQGAFRGYSPVTWCADRLPASIRVIRPEEMLWRLRMQHDPGTTAKLIASWTRQ